MNKADILAFLDKKFTNTEKDKKRSKKEKKKGKEKSKRKPITVLDNPISTVVNSELSQKKEHVTEDKLYKELIKQSEIDTIYKKQQHTDSMGVQQLKEFHLKSAETYDKELKQKIFFIGQNALQGTAVHQDGATLEEQSRFAPKRRVQQKALSKNTIKQLERMHENQAQKLEYETFKKMNHLWQQYITILLQVRPNDLKDGITTSDAANQASLCGKLVKADFSGAEVEIIKAKNQTLVGTKGIVVRESTRTFTIIQPDNAVKTLLKEGTVFQFKLPAHLISSQKVPLAVNIWGDNILYKGSVRTKIKFKEKYALQLY